MAGEIDTNGWRLLITHGCKKVRHQCRYIFFIARRYYVYMYRNIYNGKSLLELKYIQCLCSSLQIIFAEFFLHCTVMSHLEFHLFW